jgi:hypothetical protein
MGSPFAVALQVSSAELALGFFGSVGVLAGLVMVHMSYMHYRDGQLMRNTPTSEVESVAVGATELHGTVERAEGVVPAMLSDETCAVSIYKVSYRADDDWVTDDREVTAVPFYLDDGTGRILVDPPTWFTDCEFSEAATTVETYEEDESPPEAVERFLDAHTDADVESDRKRRFEQRVLRFDEEAYVFGDAELSADVETSVDPAADAADLVITKDEDTELYLVSDMTEEELLDERLTVTLMGTVLGLGVFAGGLWAVLAAL